MLSLLWFILILGAIVAVHEFGHFIFAKLANVYVYEFSIGMGKKIFGKKKKDQETEFCIRAVPLGGYVMIAGEDVEDEDIPKNRQMCNKNFIQRFLILFAGPFNNFLFAFIILFLSAIFFDDYPAYNAGIESGDLILSIDGKKIKNWDKALILLQTSEGKTMTIEVKKKNGDVVKYEVTPIEDTDSEGNTSYKFGISANSKKEYGFIKSIKYAFNRTVSLFVSMFDTLKYLFAGKVGVNQLSGPVGIYSIIDSQAKEGFEAL